jgi:hypothetical protein
MQSRHLHNASYLALPPINPRIIKRLGAEFCKVDKQICYPKALAATKPKLGVIQRPCKTNSNTRGKTEKKYDKKKGPKSPDI